MSAVGAGVPEVLTQIAGGRIEVQTDDARLVAEQLGVDKEKITWIDTNPIHNFKYSDVMLYTYVPEDARNDVARKVADKILAKLRE